MFSVSPVALSSVENSAWSGRRAASRHCEAVTASAASAPHAHATRGGRRAITQGSAISTASASIGSSTAARPVTSTLSTGRLRRSDTVAPAGTATSQASM
jgi:hypothetical protein